MRSVIQSRLVLIGSVGSLALAGFVSACSSSSSGSPSGTGNEGDGGGSSSSSGAGTSSGATASSSSGAASSSSGSSGGTASSSSSSSGGGSDASTDGATSTTEAGACSGTEVTVYNFESWCSVSVAGAATAVHPSYTACVTSGTATLVATPASSTFELGSDPWVKLPGVDGGTGGTVSGTGATATSTVSVAVSGSASCVLVCCPFSSDGTGCTSAFNGFTAFEGNCP